MLDKVEFIQVDVPAGEHRKPEFVAKNPSAAVPVLELDDGTCIAECTAITEYVDNLDGKPSLTGRTARESALVHMMQRRAEAGLLDAVVTYFHHATPGLGATIELYQNKEWGEYQLKRAFDGMRYLDSVLAKQPYLAGEFFSMADITAFAGMSLFDFLGLAMQAELPNLKAWRARVAERPSISAAFA